MTVTPWGTLVLAEDGVGASHVLSWVPGGPTYAVARNQLNIGTQRTRVLGVHRADVLRGRQDLFVNIQAPGITLAITGPVGEVPVLTQGGGQGGGEFSPPRRLSGGQRS